VKALCLIVTIVILEFVTFGSWNEVGCGTGEFSVSMGVSSIGSDMLLLPVEASSFVVPCN